MMAQSKGCLNQARDQATGIKTMPLGLRETLAGCYLYV